MEQNRANAESFLVSSIVSTAQSENRVVMPHEFSYNKSTPMMAVEHSITTSPASSPVLGQQINLSIPRIGFSANSFIRVGLTIGGSGATPANDLTVADLFTSALVSKEQGLLRLIKTLRIKTRKQVIANHDRHSMWVALETLEDDVLRDIFRLALCQGVLQTGVGASAKGVILGNASTTVYMYIPLQLFFPMFGGKSQQALDLAFVEPLTIELTTEAGSVLFGANKFVSGTAHASAGAVMTSCDLVSSHNIYDADAYNQILKKYQSMSKIQYITADYYTNNNIVSVGANTNEVSAKLEGIKNATNLYVVGYDGDGRVSEHLARVRLTSGNKDILNYSRFESQALAFTGLSQGKAYKDNLVVDLGFSMNNPLLDLESYGGSISVSNLVDPRIHLVGTGTAFTGYVVAKQLSTVVVSTANGAVELGASN